MILTVFIHSFINKVPFLGSLSPIIFVVIFLRFTSYSPLAQIVSSWFSCRYILNIMLIVKSPTPHQSRATEVSRIFYFPIGEWLPVFQKGTANTVTPVLAGFLTSPQKREEVNPN